jgi:uncharacterized protein YjeT (DUF2065 family)
MDLGSQILLIAGVLLILEGMPYVGFPESFQRWAERLAQIAPARLRKGGLVMMGLGLALLALRRLLFL